LVGRPTHQSQSAAIIPLAERTRLQTDPAPTNLPTELPSRGWSPSSFLPGPFLDLCRFCRRRGEVEAGSGRIGGLAWMRFAPAVAELGARQIPSAQVSRRYGRPWFYLDARG
jgi:hypothetical protein